MKIEAKQNCPLDGFKPCRQLECAWFIKIGGNHPQTDQYLEEWGCAQAWMPILLIENNIKQIQTGASIDSFRNEMVKSNAESAELFAKTILRGMDITKQIGED
jgi:hypothetical protein